MAVRGVWAPVMSISPHPAVLVILQAGRHQLCPVSTAAHEVPSASRFEKICSNERRFGSATFKRQTLIV